MKVVKDVVTTGLIIQVIELLNDDCDVLRYGAMQWGGGVRLLVNTINILIQ